MPVVDDSIRYIDRTRDYYLALGYEKPYQWAHFEEVPFARLAKPLSACRIGIVTTAAPFRADLGDQGAGAPPNARAKFTSVYSLPTDQPPDLRTSHVSYDREHARVEDLNGYFPLERLREAEAAGRIGSVAPRFHGVPTTYSQRNTIERDAPEVVRRCQEDGVDAALLIAL